MLTLAGGKLVIENENVRAIGTLFEENESLMLKFEYTSEVSGEYVTEIRPTPSKPETISSLSSVVEEWGGFVKIHRIPDPRLDWTHVGIFGFLGMSDGMFEFMGPLFIKNGYFRLSNGKLVVESERGQLTGTLYQGNGIRILKFEGTTKEGGRSYFAEVAESIH